MTEPQERDTQPERLPSLSDQELVVLARQGRQRAFRELQQRLEGPVRRFLYTILSDPQAVEDATAETFARAFVDIEKYDGKRKFSPWVFGIAHHVACYMLDHESAEKVPIHDDSLESTSEIIASSAVQIADRKSQPVDPALWKELKVVVAHAMAELRPEYRMAILMSEEGFTDSDTAQVLKVGINTARTWISRARQHVRKRVKEHLDR